MANAQTKILDLAAAEDKGIADFFSKKRTHALRADSFRDALSALNGDTSPQAKNAIKVIEAKVARERAGEKEMEMKISDARTRLAALREAASVFGETVPISAKKITTSASSIAHQPETKVHKDLRPSSELYTVREILRKNGKPTELDEILVGLGHPGEKSKRSSLRGTLMGYAKLGHVFTLESKKPHVFGLLEFKK